MASGTEHEIVTQSRLCLQEMSDTGFLRHMILWAAVLYSGCSAFFCQPDVFKVYYK